MKMGDLHKPYGGATVVLQTKRHRSDTKCVGIGGYSRNRWSFPRPLIELSDAFLAPKLGSKIAEPAHPYDAIQLPDPWPFLLALKDSELLA